MKLAVLTLITGTTLLFSCSKHDVAPIQNPTELSFSKSIQPISSSKCVECHDVTTHIPLYQRTNWIVLDQEGILRPVVFQNKHVYIENPLDQQEKKIIQAWIDAGYPE